MTYERAAFFKSALIGAGSCLALALTPAASGQTGDPIPPTSLPPLVDPAENYPPTAPAAPGATPVEPASPTNPNTDGTNTPAANGAEPPAVQANLSVDPVIAPAPLTFDTFTDAISMVGSPHPSFEIWKFQVGLSLRFDLNYDDNIFLQKNNGVSGSFLRVAPTISLASAGRLSSSLIYTPTMSFVLDGPVRDTLDHDLAIRLQTGTEKTTVGYQLNYQRRSGSNIEFAGRVNSDFLTNRATIRYQVTEKTATHLEAGYELRSFGGGNDSSDEYVEPYVSYRFRGKWRLNLGAHFGLNQNTNSPDQTTQSPTIRLLYEPTEKWDFSLSGGYEFRQVKGGRDFASPTFSLSTRYAFRANTTVSFDASRQVRVSDAFANQLVEGYYLRTQLRQRILSRFTVSLSGGYSNEEYTHSDNYWSVPRTDEYFYLQPQLEFPIGSQQNLTLYYMRRELTSTLQSSGFDNNQFGLLWSLNF